MLYGAYALVDGAFALIAAFTGAAKPAPWWLVVVDLLGVLAGIVTFLWPGVTALILLFFIGGWAIAHGIRDHWRDPTPAGNRQRMVADLGRRAIGDLRRNGADRPRNWRACPYYWVIGAYSCPGSTV